MNQKKLEKAIWDRMQVYDRIAESYEDGEMKRYFSGKSGILAAVYLAIRNEEKLDDFIAFTKTLND